MEPQDKAYEAGRRNGDTVATLRHVVNEIKELRTAVTKWPDTCGEHRDKIGGRVDRLYLVIVGGNVAVIASYLLIKALA